MAAGVDPIGQTEDASRLETICSKAGISKVVVRILLIALVVSMTGVAPDQVDALLLLIGV